MRLPDRVSFSHQRGNDLPKMLLGSLWRDGQQRLPHPSWIKIAGGRESSTPPSSELEWWAPSGQRWMLELVKKPILRRGNHCRALRSQSHIHRKVRGYCSPSRSTESTIEYFGKTQPGVSSITRTSSTLLHYMCVSFAGISSPLREICCDLQREIQFLQIWFCVAPAGYPPCNFLSKPTQGAWFATFHFRRVCGREDTLEATRRCCKSKDHRFFPETCTSSSTISETYRIEPVPPIQAYSIYIEIWWY